MSKWAPKFYDVLGKVEDHIDATVGKILGLCKVHSNPGTRYNALYALYSIMSAPMNAVSTNLTSKVRNEYNWYKFCGWMHELVLSMSPEERQAIYNDKSSLKALWTLLHELEDDAKGYCLFPHDSGTTVTDVIKLIAERHKEKPVYRGTRIGESWS